MIFSSDIMIKNFGRLYRKAQRKGYYSTSHSLTSAVAWASINCPSMSGSHIVKTWLTGYNN